MTSALMYHELARPGRPLCNTEPGYVRYVLPEAQFAAQLAWIAGQGLRAVSVGDACASHFDAPARVILTFDDGCETDWVVAAPLLLTHGFGATFYVVSEWVGRRAGFLTPTQLRDLATAGFEVGSHSATHAFLPDLDRRALEAELVDSKHRLEDIVGRRVAHFSCPGGRWSRGVASGAREAGYETVATSRIGVSTPRSDRYALARCAVLRATPQAIFESFCRGRGLAAMQVREHALAAAKGVLGNRLYTRLRSAALGRS